MDRREMLGTAVAAVAAVSVGSGVGAVACHTVDERPGLRAVWRWHEPSKEWIRCRMDTLKPGDTFSIEIDERTGSRFVGKVASHPRYLPDGVCEITGTGEDITV